MPTPGKKETKKDFLSRCMGFPEMVKKHPDNKQRYAICNSMWDEHMKNSKASDMMDTKTISQEIAKDIADRLSSEYKINLPQTAIDLIVSILEDEMKPDHTETD